MYGYDIMSILETLWTAPMTEVLEGKNSLRLFKKEKQRIRGEDITIYVNADKIEATPTIFTPIVSGVHGALSGAG